MATVLSLRRCPTGKGGTAESSISQSKHRQKNTQIKLLQNKTLMLVSQVYSHTYSYIYILPRSTNVLNFLHNSVIWIWWGSAPPVPNVETPLHWQHAYIYLRV